MPNYLVRQYRPAYVSGFEDQVLSGVSREDICNVPWAENFKHSGFVEFKVEPYAGDELIISAYYANGEHWVVGFALPEDSKDIAPDGGLMRDNWRYKRTGASDAT